MTNSTETERAAKLADLSDGELLNYCGDDARKWAEVFCQFKQKHGWSASEIDEGLMLGWFANAIENSSDVRCRLAAQDQKPVAWLQSRNGIDIVCKNSLVAGGFKRGWTEKPLYLSPPPAAGWGEAIKTAIDVAKRNGAKVHPRVEALRHNAPPDTGAEKPEPPDSWEDDPSADERWNAGLDFAMQQLCAALDVDPAKVTWDAATETVDGDVQSVIWNILRTRFGEDWDPDAVSPDHGGADAGVGWLSISEDTSWIDGRDVVLLAHGMEVSARYCAGEWSDETPDHPREYSGAVWSCFDDKFQLEIEECSHDPSEWGHDGATHWRPVAAHSHQPAPVAANASVEVCLLREKLSDALAGGMQHKSDCAVCSAPANEPSECDCGVGTLAHKYEGLLRGVMSQFRKKGCECSFPSETCCSYAEAEAFLSNKTNAPKANASAEARLTSDCAETPLNIAKANGLETCLDETGLKITSEIYKACADLKADACLLGQIGSWGDTLNDDDVLAGLKSYNEMGECFIPDRLHASDCDKQETTKP